MAGITYTVTVKNNLYAPAESSKSNPSGPEFRTVHLGIDEFPKEAHCRCLQDSTVCKDPNCYTTLPEKRLWEFDHGYFKCCANGDCIAHDWPWSRCYGKECVVSRDAKRKHLQKDQLKQDAAESVLLPGVERAKVFECDDHEERLRMVGVNGVDWIAPSVMAPALVAEYHDAVPSYHTVASRWYRETGESTEWLKGCIKTPLPWTQEIRKAHLHSLRRNEEFFGKRNKEPDRELAQTPREADAARKEFNDKYGVHGTEYLKGRSAQ